MAFNDTLFQLGMDLTRSSTAQKEDHARVAAFNDEVEDRFAGPIDHSISSAGTSVFIDLHGAKRLDDAKSVERAIKRAVECLGLKLKAVRSDRSGGRVSGIATLSNGRVAFQACSRSGFAAIDATGCAGLKPEAALIALANAFEAREAVIKRMRKTAPIALAPPRVSVKPSRKATVSRIHAKAA